jgi:GxxExxY protein
MKNGEAAASPAQPSRMLGEEGLMHAQELSGLTGQVVDAALVVHRALGPGLLERVYRLALRHELELRGMSVASEVAIHGTYRDKDLGCVYRCDLLVEESVLLELKAQETIERVHIRQTLTYLRLSGLPVALLLNFGAPLMRDGIVRLAN